MSSASKRRRLGLALLALSLSLVLALGALLRWAQFAGSSENGPSQLINLASDKSLGVNADLSGLDPAEIERSMAAMEDVGFRWLRQRFPWDAIEATPDAFEWGTWDAIVEAAARHGLKLIAVLDGSPAWARAAADAENRLAPPAETRDFGDFAAVFTSRYKDQIGYYQIWDEPNIAPHWGAREIDPAAYARLLREGSIRIRAEDADAVVLLAALAPNVEAGGANMSELLFLDAVYREGAAEWFDLVAVQPYGLGTSIGASPEPGDLNWRRVELVRDVMDSHADADTAVWAVSFGLPGMQPAVVAEALEYARLEWPWMGAMLWAAWFPEDTHGQYALVGGDGQAVPVLSALAADALAPVRAWPGSYSAAHPSGQYDGNWRVTPSGADIGTDGDRLTILFRGTRLDLTVCRGDYRAFLYVTVDGVPANGLPLDTMGQAYVVLYDPLHGMDTVTFARGLADGDHVAEIVADRGWGQWAIAGWMVSREMPVSMPWLPAVLGLVAVLSLGIAVGAAWPIRCWLLEAVTRLVARYRELDERLALMLTGATAVVLYVMTGTLPTLAVLGVLALFLLLRPETGLPLIAFALPFYQPGRPILGKVFSMVEILLLLTAVGWGVNWLLAKWGRTGTRVDRAGERGMARVVQGLRKLTPADWGVLALLALGACSLLWAEHGHEAAREYRTVVLEAGVFYGLLRASMPKDQSVWRMADAWVLGGTLIALVGLGQWAFGDGLITAEGVGRVRGFYGSPNNLALYLGRLLPLALAFAAWGHAGRRRWFYGLALILSAAALLLTYSRGAWIVGVPASLLFLGAVRGRRTLAVVVGVLVVLAVVVLLVAGAGRLTSLLDTDAGTTFFRIQLWRSSVNMLLDHPVLGVGLDNFLYAYRSTYVLPAAWAEFDLSHPHNFVLDFWLRLGIMGVAVVGWLLVAFFRRAWDAYCRLPQGDERLLVLGLMAGMVYFVAHGLVDNAFFLVDLAFVFMLMLALVHAVTGDTRETVMNGGHRR